MNKNTWQFVLPSLTPETKNEQMKNENGFLKIDFLAVLTFALAKSSWKSISNNKL